MDQTGLLEKAEQVFTHYVDQIELGKVSEIAIRRALKKYDVKNLKINNVTPLRAKKIYGTILPKYSTGITTDKSWLQNQRRLFVWCVVCYLFKYQLEVSGLKNEDFEFLQSMFPFKDLELIKFQIFSLIKKDNKNSSWSREEDQILKKIILNKQEAEIEWSSISKEFFALTEQKYFRNAKQCRQRWLNHLDPNKLKGKWLVEQDIVLLQQVLERGKKWSQIAQALEGKKNEHMVKNRYKSLIHKKQKSQKNNKIKENELIVMLLEDLAAETKREGPSSDKESEEILDAESNDDKNFEEEEEEPCQTNKIEEQQSKEKKSEVKKKGNWPIIVQPSKKKSSAKQQFTAPALEQMRNIEEDQGQNDYKNQIQIYGNRQDADNMYERLFQSAGTPGGFGNDRYPPMCLQSRSPANLFTSSPFASVCPAGWNQSFFLLEGQRDEASPVVSLGNFHTIYKSNFHQFVAEDQDEKPQK